MSSEINPVHFPDAVAQTLNEYLPPIFGTLESKVDQVRERHLLEEVFHTSKGALSAELNPEFGYATQIDAMGIANIQQFAKQGNLIELRVHGDRFFSQRVDREDGEFNFWRHPSYLAFKGALDNSNGNREIVDYLINTPVGSQYVDLALDHLAHEYLPFSPVSELGDAVDTENDFVPYTEISG